MGDLDATFEKSDLVKGLNIRRQTGVHTENAAFNDCTDAKVVENLCAILPGVGISVFSHDFIVESIHRCNLSSLVVSPEKSNRAWVSRFEQHQVGECFD